MAQPIDLTQATSRQIVGSAGVALYRTWSAAGAPHAIALEQTRRVINRAYPDISFDVVAPANDNRGLDELLAMVDGEMRSVR